MGITVLCSGYDMYWEITHMYMCMNLSFRIPGIIYGL